VSTPHLSPRGDGSSAGASPISSSVLRSSLGLMAQWPGSTIMESWELEALSLDAAASAAAGATAAPGFIQLRRGFRAPSAEELDFREDVAAVAAAAKARREAARLRAEQERHRAERVASVRAARLAADPVGAAFHADDYEEGEFEPSGPDSAHEPTPTKPHTPRALGLTRTRRPSYGNVPSPRPGSKQSGRQHSWGSGPPQSGNHSPASLAQRRGLHRASSGAHASPSAGGGGKDASAGNATPLSPSSRAVQHQQQQQQAQPPTAEALGASLVQVRFPSSGASAQRIDLDALTEQLARWGSGLAKLHGAARPPAPAAAAVNPLQLWPVLNAVSDGAASEGDGHGASDHASGSNSSNATPLMHSQTSSLHVTPVFSPRTIGGVVESATASPRVGPA